MLFGSRREDVSMIQTWRCATSLPPRPSTPVSSATHASVLSIHLFSFLSSLYAPDQPFGIQMSLPPRWDSTHTSCWIINLLVFLEAISPRSFRTYIERRHSIYLFWLPVTYLSICSRKFSIHHTRMASTRSQVDSHRCPMVSLDYLFAWILLTGSSRFPPNVILSSSQEYQCFRKNREDQRADEDVRPKRPKRWHMMSERLRSLVPSSHSFYQSCRSFQLVYPRKFLISSTQTQPMIELQDCKRIKELNYSPAQADEDFI